MNKSLLSIPLFFAFTIHAQTGPDSFVTVCDTPSKIGRFAGPRGLQGTARPSTAAAGEPTGVDGELREALDFLESRAKVGKLPGYNFRKWRMNVEASGLFVCTPYLEDAVAAKEKITGNMCVVFATGTISSELRKDAERVRSLPKPPGRLEDGPGSRGIVESATAVSDSQCWDYINAQ